MPCKLWMKKNFMTFFVKHSFRAKNHKRFHFITKYKWDVVSVCKKKERKEERKKVRK